MARTDTWMPLYIGDYLADTMHLSGEEHGPYLLLLMHYWRTGPLLDNDRFLCGIARVSRRTWDAGLGEVVRAFFRAEDGKLYHKRVDAEISKARDVSEKRSAAGKRGAASKHGKEVAEADVVPSGCDGKAPDNGVAIATNVPGPGHTQLQSHSSLRSETESGIGLMASPQPKPAEAPTLIHDSRQLDLVEAVSATAKVVRVGHDPAEAVVLWNAMAAAHGLPQVQRLHDERKRHLQARLRECGGIEGWRVALAKLAASPFHLGQNDRGWRADIDYVLKPAKFARLMESLPSKPAAKAKQPNGWDEVFDTIREFNA